VVADSAPWTGRSAMVLQGSTNRIPYWMGLVRVHSWECRGDASIRRCGVPPARGSRQPATRCYSDRVRARKSSHFGAPHESDADDRETGDFVMAETCMYHDHLDPLNPGLLGSIVIVE